MENARSVIELRLALDHASISGELGSADGPMRPFSGYAGLIAVLESFRAELADRADSGPGDAGAASAWGRS